MDNSIFDKYAARIGARPMREIAALPTATQATPAELQLMRDALEYKQDLTDDELRALCQWFRGNSSLEQYAHFERGLNLR